MPVAQIALRLKWGLSGAPLNPHFKRKAIWATGIAAVLWVGFYFAIGFGWLEL